MDTFTLFLFSLVELGFSKSFFTVGTGQRPSQSYRSRRDQLGSRPHRTLKGPIRIASPEPIRTIADSKEDDVAIKRKKSRDPVDPSHGPNGWAAGGRAHSA